MDTKKIAQTPTVISKETNGSRTRPFSFLRTPRLTFVSFQPIESRWKNPGFLAAGHNGTGATAGVGDHMETRRAYRARLHQPPRGGPPPAAPPPPRPPPGAR